jgi:hypothetical protein
VRLPKIITATAVVLCAVLSASSSAGAAEQSAAERLDESVRCFGIASVMMTLNDDASKQSGQMAGLYFMGRLDGALSDKELEDRMFAFSQGLPKEDVQKLLTRCGDIMKVRGDAIQAIGGRVSAREEAAAAAAKK